MPVRFEAGVLSMHSEIQAIKNDLDVLAAAKIAQQANTRDNLEKRFFADQPSLVDLQEILSGGRVAVIEPTGKYAEKSFLVVAAGPDSLRSDPVPTEHIYAYPREIQQAYWEKSVRILRQFDSEKSEREVAVITENSMVAITNERQRIPRTIALPHAQVICLNLDHIEPNPDQKPDHLRREQGALKRALTILALPQHIEDGMKRLLGDEVPHVAVNLESPVGYSFQVGPANDTSRITATLAAHHQVYAEHAVRWYQAQTEERQRRLIPQPSYRLYLTLENGQLVATVSPAFTSYAAVLEAAEVVLSRSVDTPVRLSQEELKGVRQRVLQALTARE